jgi:hypothetical protein
VGWRSAARMGGAKKWPAVSAAVKINHRLVMSSSILSLWRATRYRAGRCLRSTVTSIGFAPLLAPAYPSTTSIPFADCTVELPL